jgi:chemotaxis protein MotB
MSAVGPNEPAGPARKKPIPPPPAADRQVSVETIEWEEPPARPKTRSTGLIIACIATSLLAIGLGYAGFQQWQAQQSTLAALTKTHAEVQALTQARAKLQLSLTEAQQHAAEQQQRVEQDAQELNELKTKLGATEARLNELEAQSEALGDHLAEFRAVSKQFQRMIDSGKLQISFRRGRMIVELPAAVLFASGKAELSPEGRQALQEIAKILRKVPGKRFIVGGHTDDVPIGKATGDYSSNWSLSAARAVTVTESLIAAGLRANHLVAAGYGEYDPIASNAGERGRQKNRRMEIVLEPELAALPETMADAKHADAPSKPAAKPAAKSAKH